jgi:hypothetical protein
MGKRVLLINKRRGGILFERGRTYRFLFGSVVVESWGFENFYNLRRDQNSYITHRHYIISLGISIPVSAEASVRFNCGS